MNLAALAERLHKDWWTGSDVTFQDGVRRLTNSRLLELATVVSSCEINFMMHSSGVCLLQREEVEEEGGGVGERESEAL